MRILDIHTHAFPDAIAAKAIASLNEGADSPAVLDGTLGGLLASMDEAGIELSVVSSIATRPGYFESILRWSKTIPQDRLRVFPSVYPLDPEAANQVQIIADEGFKGIKLHPYYQDFAIDDDRLAPFYEAVVANGLLLLVHTGYDMAFDRYKLADPRRVLTILERFQGLKLITSHMLAWEDWEDARELLLGKPILTDLSYSVQFWPREQAREWLLAHPVEYTLFGTDSPWAGQQETIDYVRSLELGPEYEKAIFWDNAARLLGLDGA